MITMILVHAAVQHCIFMTYALKRMLSALYMILGYGVDSIVEAACNKELLQYIRIWRLD